MTDDTPTDGHRQAESTLNRRRVLQAVSAGAIGAGTGLAGCLGGLESGGPRTERKNAPNATYEPTDEHPLIGYDKTTKTKTKTVGGNEVTVELTIDFFVYDLLGGQYGAGTVLIPQVSMAGVPLVTFADKTIEEVMTNPGDRTEILEALDIDADIAEAQSNPQMVGRREVPNPEIFTGDDTPRVETWVMAGEENSVLVDLVKGPLNIVSLETDYDGEVTFATGVQRTYTDVPSEGEGETPVGTVIPEDDIQTARNQHDGLMEEGLVILENPSKYLSDETTTPTETPTEDFPALAKDVGKAIAEAGQVLHDDVDGVNSGGAFTSASDAMRGQISGVKQGRTGEGIEHLAEVMNQIADALEKIGKLLNQSNTPFSEVQQAFNDVDETFRPLAWNFAGKELGTRSTKNIQLATKSLRLAIDSQSHKLFTQFKSKIKETPPTKIQEEATEILQTEDPATRKRYHLDNPDIRRAYKQLANNPEKYKKRALRQASIDSFIRTGSEKFAHYISLLGNTWMSFPGAAPDAPPGGRAGFCEQECINQGEGAGRNCRITRKDQAVPCRWSPEAWDLYNFPGTKYTAWTAVSWTVQGITDQDIYDLCKWEECTKMFCKYQSGTNRFGNPVYKKAPWYLWQPRSEWIHVPRKNNGNCYNEGEDVPDRKHQAAKAVCLQHCQ